MIRESKAHGEHEKSIGHECTDWAKWYTEYMIKERPGEELPK